MKHKITRKRQRQRQIQRQKKRKSNRKTRRLKRTLTGGVINQASLTDAVNKLKENLELHNDDPAYKYRHTYFNLWNAYWFYGEQLFIELLGDLYATLNDADKTFEKLPNLYFKQPPKIIGFNRDDIMDDSIMAGLTPLNNDIDYSYENMPDDRILSKKIKNLTKDEFIGNLSFLKESIHTTLIIGALNIKVYNNLNSIVTTNVVDVDMDYTNNPNRIDLMCDLNDTNFPDWLGDYKFDTIVCESIPVYICVNPFFFGNVKRLLKPHGALYINNLNALKQQYGVDDEFIIRFMKNHGFTIDDVVQADIKELNSLYKSGNKYIPNKLSKLRVNY